MLCSPAQGTNLQYLARAQTFGEDGEELPLQRTDGNVGHRGVLGALEVSFERSGPFVLGDQLGLQVRIRIFGSILGI